MVRRRTRDRKVASSTPGRGAIKSPRSTQPSIPPRQVNRVPACMAGVRRGTFTCARWQVTLCDPIRQVTSCSSEMGFPWRDISAIITRTTKSQSPLPLFFAFLFFSPSSPWKRNVVVRALASINVVNQHWARLLLGWVTAHGQVNRLCDSAFYPLRDGKMSISFRAE